MDKKVLTESGILLVDKPLDWTSHDVVGFIRRFGFKKVGHCGTLDPKATGLLVVVLGRATKLSEKLTGQQKYYTGTLELGISTDSYDVEGKVISTRPWEAVSEERIRDEFDTYSQITEQTPPMVSAKKVKGKELYKYHREGKEIEREARPVKIDSLDVLEVARPRVSFELVCSKGFYVRTLCNDIGETLGCGGHLAGLRRTRSGRFSIDDAVDIETLRTWRKEHILERMIPLASAVSYI